MSRIGKKPIEIPANIEVKITGQLVSFKGPKGEISQEAPEEIEVVQKDKELLLRPKRRLKNTAALWGLSRALLQNCLDGVLNGFEKKLEIIGVGYKANMEGEKTLNLALGFSHPVKMAIPDGLKILVEKNIITISGINKQEVGQFAAEIRDQKRPEPYKGKGIRYLGEKVRRKEGKKAGTA